MKISYNWLKWYTPDLPPKDEMWDIFTYHLCEVESVEDRPDGDTIFDINILPNRAHDLLSHQGIARELSSLLNITFIDPTPKYKIPPLRQGSAGQALKIDVQSNKCRRYMGRIVRNVKVGGSPEWVKNHLESIGQRSINNIVDGANITMYDCGQPIHCFDLDKVTGSIIVREAKDGEVMTTLDNKEVKLTSADLVIADEKNVLAIAGVKGGKVAEVDENTKNIIIEVANFDPVSVRKTWRRINIFTDAGKRFENDLSPTLCDFAMLEMSGLLVEYGFTDFEEVVDVYKIKPEARTLTFSVAKISKMLGIDLAVEEVKDILDRYNFSYENTGSEFLLKVPPMRLDLEIEEDMAEEVGRVLGYDKVVPLLRQGSAGQAPIEFAPKENEEYAKIQKARVYLLSQGYNEVMTYSFCDKGKVEVLHSAGDKNFLRTNIGDGLSQSMKLNDVNESLILNPKTELKIFEIGRVWEPEEKIKVAFMGGKMQKPKEYDLDDFYKTIPDDFKPEINIYNLETKFNMWSLYPFIARDIALWVPENVTSEEVAQVIRLNTNELVVKGPDLFDRFTKEGRTSYAFRLVFQSHERTLTDDEVNKVMQKITDKLKEHPDWQVR